MAELGDSLVKRIAELSARYKTLRPRFAAIAKGATIRAVQEAQRLTAPNDGKERGTNMVTGDMAESWETASITEPEITSDHRYITHLNNNEEYASYVNDGHVLRKRFVKGLYIDEDGHLSRNADGSGGLMVGTKTSYVPGLYMKEAATELYHQICRQELKKIPGDIFK